METVKYTCREDHLAIVTLARPEKKNAINEQLFHDMAEAWNKFQADENAWVAIINAEGDIFSAGADLSMVKKQMDPDFDFMSWYRGLVAADPYQSGRLHKPVIAAVEGDAYGGGLSLILCADLIVCAEGHKFRMPELDFGGIVHMWQNVPRAFCMELNMGNFVSGERFYSVGVFNRIVAQDEVMETAEKLAKGILRKPPMAVHASCEILHDFYEGIKPYPAAEMKRKASEAGEALARTEDKAEAVKAFSEKRPAEYKYR